MAQYLKLFGLLRPLLRGHWLLGIGVLLSFLVASVAEGIGFSLVIPLIELLTSGSSGRPEFGFLGSALQQVAAFFPADHRLEGVLGLLVLVFFVKSATLVSATAMSRYFVNTLRLEWVAATFRAYLQGSYLKIAAAPQGAVVQNIMGESETAAKSVQVLVETMARALQIAIFVTVLALVNWRVTLAIGVGALCVVAVLWRSSGRFSTDSGRARRKLRREMTDVVAESVLSLRSMKLLDLLASRQRRLRQYLTDYRSIDTRFEIVSALPSILTDFWAVALGAAVVLTATLGFGLSVQVVLPMVALFGLVFLRLIGAGSYLFSKRMQLLAAIPSLETVSALMQTEPESGGERRIDKIEGPIRLEGIVLDPPRRKRLFDGLDLVVPPVGVTAIVGPSGVGKTTLVDFLVRLREPDMGRITIGGVDIREFDLRSLRQRIGYVTQEPQLLNGTVRENLLLGRSDATEAELLRALARARAHDFVMAMPQGLETPLGRGAVTLSGGQKQRLVLARELLREPDLYIFDEPTSALDREAEAAIRDLIEELAQDHPIVLIAHRLDTIRNARAIYRIEGGRAIPATFRELVAEGQALAKAPVSA